MNLHKLDGSILAWDESCRYLGVTLLAARQFKCSFSNAKRSLYRSFNIYGKVGNSASESVVLQLLQSKCMPALLYRLEACPVNSADKSSVEFAHTRLLIKLFRTGSNVIISECKTAFGLRSVTEYINSRKIMVLS
jgi:hypothetical protein